MTYEPGSLMPHSKGHPIILIMSRVNRIIVIQPIYLRSILILSFHLSLVLHWYPFSIVPPVNIFKTPLPSPILRIWTAHLNLLHLSPWLYWAKGTIYQIPHYEVFSIPIFTALGRNTLGSCSRILLSFDVRGEFWQPYNGIANINVFFIF